MNYWRELQQLPKSSDWEINAYHAYEWKQTMCWQLKQNPSNLKLNRCVRRAILWAKRFQAQNKHVLCSVDRDNLIISYSPERQLEHAILAPTISVSFRVRLP